MPTYIFSNGGWQFYSTGFQTRPPASKNARTLEYRNYNDPIISGLKSMPLKYVTPGHSSVQLSDDDGTTTLMEVIPKTTTASTTVAELGPNDAGAWLRLDHATDTTYTLVTGFAKNAMLLGVQAGLGKLMFTGTINPVSGYLPNTRAQGAVFCLIHLGSNVWDIMGDLEAEAV